MLIMARFRGYFAMKETAVVGAVIYELNRDMSQSHELIHELWRYHTKAMIYGAVWAESHELNVMRWTL